MSGILDFLGLSPFGVNGIPAIHRDKEQAAYEAGRLAVQLVRDNVTPRSLVTRGVVRERRCLGRGDGRIDECRPSPRRDRARLRLEFTIDDFERISAKTPIIADMKPWGAGMRTTCSAPAVAPSSPAS
jgi:dihydroxy-acid dehydratase